MLTRRSTLAVAAAALGSLALPAGRAFAAATRDPEAEAFMVGAANSTLELLNDSKLSAADRTAKFSAAMDKYCDIPTVARFALGRYRSRFDDKTYAEYSKEFRNYLLAAYQGQLDRFRGEKVTLLGSTVRKPGDVVVNTRVSQKRAGKEDLPVNWRVKKGADGWRIIDLSALGVWLAIEQQASFGNALDQANGDPKALIAYVKKSAADLRAGIAK
jgi:phospholipid transport system substrate-binding protein